MLITLAQARATAELPKLSQPLPGTAQVLKAVAGEFRVERLRLEGGQRSGVEIIVVDTGRVRAAIIPTRGLSLWRAWIDGVDYGWESPVAGPIHPQWVALSEAGGLGWLDGFDELLVRCGLRSFGAPDFDDESGRVTFPLHGRIGNLPADNLVIDFDAEHSLLHVRGTVRETRFLQYNLQLTANYTFAIDSPTIAINDTVVNASDVPTTMQLLYHINVGAPLLAEGSRLHLKAPRVVARNQHAADDLPQWATYAAPRAGYVEQVYFSSPIADSKGNAIALLASADQKRGFAVHYHTQNLPYFTQWKNTVGARDGYVTGLEPGTGFPNPRSFEEQQGRVVSLASQQSLDFKLTLEGIATPARMQQLKDQLDPASGAELVGFDPSWCVPRND